MDRFLTDDVQVESALAEWDAAERAGVFRTTPTPIAALSKPRRLFLWVPSAVAAMVALAVTGWAFFAQASKPRGEVVAIASCLKGPGQEVNVLCQPYDLDHDGDVDLADVSQVQLK